jgi:hypothetical protein
METRKILTILALALGLIVSQAEVSEAASMGTAWAYQGRLIDANSPADGLYDFQFKVYDANAAGIQEGGTIDIHDLDVIDGYFIVELDFGSDVFNGDARWLGVAVRPGDSNDVNDFVTLIPRQEITPVPYALHTRGIFVDDAGNVSIGTNAPDPEDKLYVVATGSDSMGVLAEATHPTGDTVGLEGVVYSPNGIAGSFVNESGAGRVLICHSGPDPYTHAFSVDSDGDIWVEGSVFTRGKGSSNFGGDLYVHGTQHVASNLSTNGNLGVNGTADVLGDLNVGGHLSKGSGSFKIDHPLDPENKYLSHSFVESPDMMNVYNGNVVLDENGGALIKLPEYFEALNVDFRYQLTCIGGFACVFISEEISNNHFKIGGGQKGMKVSWQVTGIRQDAYAKTNRIVVEEDKSAGERGYYLHPTAYGLPEDKGIAHHQNQQTGPVTQVARKTGER